MNLKIISEIEGILLKGVLQPEDKIIEITYNDLFGEIKEEFNIIKKNINKQKGSICEFTNPVKTELVINRDLYLSLINLKESIINRRSISDKSYLKYLLQSLNLTELKTICKEHKIKGYSQFSKIKLIEYMIDNLTEEKHRELIIEKEREIISLTIANALKMLSNKDKQEKFKGIKTLNHETKEIELIFEGIEWKVNYYLCVEEIKDPERICDCKIGENGGFCKHFFIALMKLFKERILSIYEWNLTFLPENFERFYENIKLR